jgi:enediyne biosynthesis protein E4
MTRLFPLCPGIPLLALGSAALLATAEAQDRAVPDAEVLTSTPLTIAPAPGAEAPLFEAVPAEQTGVGMSHAINSEHKLRRLYPYGWATGGVAIGDVNGDGKADLVFAGGPGQARLYLQTGDFQFFDATATSGIATGDRWCSGIALADIDNDGDLDIYLTVYGEPNLLYINQTREGRVSFDEKAQEWGADIPDGSLNAAFADFDRDGWLDLYVQTYHLEPETGRPPGELNITIREGIPLLQEEWRPYYVVRKTAEGGFAWTEGGRPDYLLRNTGEGGFEEITEAAGIHPGRAYGSSVTWWDADHDGFPDLHVGNDALDPDLFYRNSGGRGFAQGANRVFPHTPWFTRGTVAADFNNDLLMDLLTTNAGPRSAAEAAAMGFPTADFRAAMLSAGGAPQVFRNTLLINAGTARFFDAAWMAGLAHAGAVWNVKAGDFDNDGWIDAFFANGSVRDWWKHPPDSLAGANLAGKTRWDLLGETPERREGNLAFRNLGDLKFDDATAAWGLGHDGMSLASAAGDLDGDGDLDLVVCHAGERVTLYRNHSTGNRIRLRLLGKQSNSWGIGAEAMIATAGRVQMRQLYPHSGSLASDEPVIHFGLGDATKVDRLTIRWPSGATETFENLEANRAYTVTEATSVIPPMARFRTAKPMFSGADLLGGSGLLEEAPEKATETTLPEWLGRLGPGQAWVDLDGDGKEELFFPGSRNRPARLVSQSLDLAKLTQPFGADALSEDAGAVFFDADNDGDADLYVASGGPEAAAGAWELRDRLYLNEKLTFTKAPAGRLPDLRDASGPVAAADFDRDGDVDLFVGGRLTAGAYPGAPKSRLLINDGKGSFSDQAGKSAAPGLEDSGMVSGALWTDIDGDGWLDLVVATDRGPIRVWKNTAGTLADISQTAGTATLIGRWSGIAGGDIDQDGDIDYVVTNLGLNTGDPTAESEILESGVMINDGAGVFEFRSLPRVAQTAPAYGVVIADLNFDGRADVYLAQNREHAGHSADPANSGLSLLLLGTGNPSQPLQPVSPDSSGLVLFGQGRSVAVVDLNDDDRPDLVVGLNEADPAAFLNEVASADFRALKISLSEPGRHSAGARVTVTCEGLPPQVAEYHAGGGFFSQSPPNLFFAAPKKAGASAKISIRWSNGETTERTIYFE